MRDPNIPEMVSESELGQGVFSTLAEGLLPDTTSSGNPRKTSINKDNKRINKSIVTGTGAGVGGSGAISSFNTAEVTESSFSRNSIEASPSSSSSSSTSSSYLDQQQKQEQEQKCFGYQGLDLLEDIVHVAEESVRGRRQGQKAAYETYERERIRLDVTSTQLEREYNLNLNKSRLSRLSGTRVVSASAAGYAGYDSSAGTSVSDKSNEIKSGKNHKNHKNKKSVVVAKVVKTAINGEKDIQDIKDTKDIKDIKGIEGIEGVKLRQDLFLARSSNSNLSAGTREVVITIGGSARAREANRRGSWLSSRRNKKMMADADAAAHSGGGFRVLDLERDIEQYAEQRSMLELSQSSSVQVELLLQRDRTAELLLKTVRF